MEEKTHVKLTLEEVEEMSPEELGKMLKEKLVPHLKSDVVSCFLCIPCSG